MVINGRIRMTWLCFFIYTPVFTISLASKERRTSLRAIHYHYHRVPYFHSRKYFVFSLLSLRLAAKSAAVCNGSEYHMPPGGRDRRDRNRASSVMPIHDPSLSLPKVFRNERTTLACHQNSWALTNFWPQS